MGRAEGFGSAGYDALVGTWLKRLVRVEPRIAKALFADDEDLKDWPDLDTRRGPVAVPTSPGLPLERNVSILAELLGLDALNEQVLIFAAMLASHPTLLGACCGVARCSNDRLAWLVSVALKTDTQRVVEVLRGSGPLTESGLLRVDSGFTDFTSKLILKDDLAGVLLSEHTRDTLLASFFDIPGGADLSREDYAHIVEHVDLLARLLAVAVKERHVGVNVLLYGPPGTGKTELAKVLAKTIGAELYAVRSADEKGESAQRHERLVSYKLCQQFVKGHGRGLVLFDEAEDVFPEDLHAYVAGGQLTLSKAWVNAMLERNPVPTIWVANEVGHIDPAYLRRFDYSLKLNVPPIDVRRKIVARYIEDDLVDAVQLDALAANSQISPGQLQRAARVAGMVKTTGGDTGAIVQRVIGQSGALLGQRKLKVGRNTLDYQIDYLNVDIDLKGLIERMAGRVVPLAMLLYGPPGTGKTAFARHLASSLRLPLHIKRASDLLSPWVGGSEQNVAEVFTAATDEGAMLLIDECESLIADRQHAVNSWEISLVNELLTQLESFDGVLICATNWESRLDEAAFRRFSFKVRFDYLTFAQKKRLVECAWPELGTDRLELVFNDLKQLTTLTLGDFAAVEQRRAIVGSLTIDAYVEALAIECSFKRRQAASAIGFLA